jgi:hypothetical protein
MLFLLLDLLFVILSMFKMSDERDRSDLGGNINKRWSILTYMLESEH